METWWLLFVTSSKKFESPTNLSTHHYAKYHKQFTVEYCDGLSNLLDGTSFAEVLLFSIAIGRHVDMPSVKRVISVPYTMEDFLGKLDEQDK